MQAECNLKIKEMEKRLRLEMEESIEIRVQQEVSRRTLQQPQQQFYGGVVR